MKFSLSEVAEVLDGQLIGEDTEFEEVCSDTRTINPGALFFALKGENFNGEAFVERAFERGACAAVLSRHQSDLQKPQLIVGDAVRAFGRLANFRRQALKATVIAITGSCGKTSVKGMLKSICELAGNTHATKANFNNHIGVPLTLFSCPEDTEFAVVEAGTSTPGEIGYLTEIIDPDIAVVINVHPAHILGFGSLNAIADEKSEIYCRGQRSPKMIVSDKLATKTPFRDKCDLENMVLFGCNTESGEFGRNNSVIAENVVLDNLGAVSFDLKVDGFVSAVKLSVPGAHQVENALAASACALSAGISQEIITQGLNRYVGEKGRMQRHFLSSGTLIDDSYNANPASMKAAIDVLSSSARSILVLSDMGELGVNAEEIHKEIGEYAAKNNINELVVLGAFADDYIEGFGMNAKKFFAHEEVIAYLNEQMDEDTTVLIKGSRFTKMDIVCRGLIALRGED